MPSFSTAFALLAVLGAADTGKPINETASIDKSSEVVVVVSNLDTGKGVIACALFSSEEGFPMDASPELQIRKDAQTGINECRFQNLAPGTYAVAVSHDENENGKTDTNFLGIPKEAWGVSNNARPRMRAPRFKEASFELAEQQTLQLEVSVK